MDLYEKIERLKSDGKDMLHIASDFDRTLTREFGLGLQVPTIWGRINQSPLLAPDYAEKSAALYREYRPIEKDESLSVDQKAKKMLEWFHRGYELLMKSGMNRFVVEQIGQQQDLGLRNGVDTFFHLTHGHDIPLVVFSAGIGDLIGQHLVSVGLMYPNVHVHSNFLHYDYHGRMIGYSTPIIHSFNKDEGHLNGTDYAQKVAARKNVIVIGDVVNDSMMCSGIEHEVELKIGFWNDSSKEITPEFRAAFDYVIEGDGPFDRVNEILLEVLGL